MREILFRGKRVDDGELVISDSLMQVKGQNPRLWVEFDGWVEVLPKTVGQFTGLTDESGEKIFEGDVVKTREFGKDSGYGVNFNGFDVFEVIYSSASFKLNNARRAFYLLNGQRIEVIGNIYDNSELLGETK